MVVTYEKQPLYCQVLTNGLFAGWITFGAEFANMVIAFIPPHVNVLSPVQVSLQALSGALTLVCKTKSHPEEE